MLGESRGTGAYGVGAWLQARRRSGIWCLEFVSASARGSQAPPGRLPVRSRALRALPVGIHITYVAGSAHAARTRPLRASAAFTRGDNGEGRKGGERGRDQGSDARQERKKAGREQEHGTYNVHKLQLLRYIQDLLLVVHVTTCKRLTR